MTAGEGEGRMQIAENVWCADHEIKAKVKVSVSTFEAATFIAGLLRHLTVSRF